MTKDVHAIVSVAMAEEAAPFLESSSYEEITHEGTARFYLLDSGQDTPVLLIHSGIGLVAAASALSQAFAHYRAPLVISAGTAGGLGKNVEVGDICISTQLSYTDVDATAFGYVRGQTPGQPAVFSAAPTYVEELKAAAQDVQCAGQNIHSSLMLAGNSFVTAANVKDTREAFPTAISTDMESTALAQVCTAHGVDYVSVRAVSDLCGPEAGQDFHMDSGMAAARSAAVVMRWLGKK